VDPADRRVTSLPLTELFDERGAVAATRRREVGPDDVAALLHSGTPVVVADVGEPLRWMGGVEAQAWWRAEAEPRLWPPDQPRAYLEDYPDGRAWRASEWRDGSRVLVFEAHH
jgi:hypothetical protein